MARIRAFFQPRVPVISLVSAAYNIAPYLDAFFNSVMVQTYDLRSVELIVVNDGSTDDTGPIIDQWVARYPKLIRSIHQTNGGVAAARNAGMARASGTWIGFPDSDDILDPDYLSQLAHAINPTETQVAIVANLIRYSEDTNSYADTHPMRYRFKKGAMTRPVHKTRDMILQSVSHAVFRRSSILANGVKFDPSIRPTFEDGHFANALLIHASEQTISFVPEAVYYYRKRAALGSAVDGSRDDPRWYTSQIAAGYLSLIKLAQDIHGHVPAFIQINCLYSMMWRFRYLVDQPDRAALLDVGAQTALCHHLTDIFAVIDRDTLMQFHRAGCSEMHKVALMARYAKGLRDPLRIQPVKIAQGLFEFQWHVGPDTTTELTLTINGIPTQTHAKSERQSLFLNQPYVRQDSVQVSVAPNDTVGFKTSDGRTVCVRDRGLDLGPQVDAMRLNNLRPVPDASA